VLVALNTITRTSFIPLKISAVNLKLFK